MLMCLHMYLGALAIAYLFALGLYAESFGMLYIYIRSYDA
jgi:hypothetical protein